MPDADIVVVGAGAAGLSLAHRLPARPSPGAVSCVVLVDPPPGPLRPPRRTWCFRESGPGRFDRAATTSWEWLRVRGRDGRAVRRHLAPARHRMIRSDDFEALVERDLMDRPGLRRVEATVGAVTALPEACVRVAATDAAGARGRPVRPGGTSGGRTARCSPSAATATAPRSVTRTRPSSSRGTWSVRICPWR
ncbi:hypothetical protein RKD44_007247 [Streptomyces collinus]